MKNLFHLTCVLFVFAFAGCQKDNLQKSTSQVGQLEQPLIVVGTYAKEHMSANEFENFEWNHAISLNANGNFKGVEIQSKSVIPGKLKYLVVTARNGKWENIFMHEITFASDGPNKEPVKIYSKDFLTGRSGTTQLKTINTHQEGIRGNARILSLVGPSQNMPMVTIIGYYNGEGVSYINNPAYYYLIDGGLGYGYGGTGGVNDYKDLAYLDPIITQDPGGCGCLSQYYSLSSNRISASGIVYAINDWNKEWTMQNIINDTQNPCITEVINTFNNISAKFPQVIRDFFGKDADFTMHLTMPDLGAGVGNNTVANVTTTNFEVRFNQYYNTSTNLAYAATLLHEGFHCQLMSWYREAITCNDVQKQQELASTYGYIFTSEITDIDNTLSTIVNNGNASQHADIVNRYITSIGEALYQFAQFKQLTASKECCYQLAWTGLYTSQCWIDKSEAEKQLIINCINAEKDPDANKGLNPDATLYQPKGHPCQ